MTTSVRFTPEIEERLNILAKETGRAKSFYIKQMVEDNIDAIEDCYLAEATLERIRSGKEQIHTSASVREELGLGD
ncbi:MAG: CopG family transcriptional regulator [Cyanobacteria bacterium PR.023]|jgi:RHH-type rel operon transcriptional repressor/antitoxin RelB|nr:CopG family transcriptional regulator [Cyanobacteria bacterium PR.023]MDQ5937562.1 RHH-type transcriptional regulator, rel operon repressor / antitoxin RelB [Cyanobacteriota bacterium erpe_2018_sw_21hr_WHONDRS-SW48-000092_B_bin.40]